MIGETTSVTTRGNTPGFALRVVLEHGSTPISTRTLTVEGELLVGRDASAGLCLEDDLVSRRHVMVRAEAEGLEVEDLSTNGTLVNGSPLRRARLLVGQECTLMLGASKLILRRIERTDPARSGSGGTPSVVTPSAVVAEPQTGRLAEPANAPSVPFAPADPTARGPEPAPARAGGAAADRGSARA
jgi:pSer/pThr/pTyr-binding forkhead associated (FHA) protein